MGSRDGGLPIGRKTGLSAVGLTTIAGQYWFASYMRADLRQEIQHAASSEIAAIREDVAGSRLERERDFVRRRDLEQLGVRIERLGERIDDLNERNAQLEGYLKGRDRHRTDLFWKRALRK